MFSLLSQIQASCLKLDDGFEIRDSGSGHGRALFALVPIPRGTRITVYGGNVVPVPAGDAMKSHMARIPGSDVCVDGLSIANALVRRPNGTWSLASMPMVHVFGFGSIANAASRVDANARLVWTPCTIPAGLVDVFAMAGVDGQRVGVLTAIRDVAVGDELRWFYRWTDSAGGVHMPGSGSGSGSEAL